MLDQILFRDEFRLDRNAIRRNWSDKKAENKGILLCQFYIYFIYFDNLAPLMVQLLMMVDGMRIV